MPSQVKITPDVVSKIEDVLEERKSRVERRKSPSKLPPALERRSGKDRREQRK